MTRTAQEIRAELGSLRARQRKLENELWRATTVPCDKCDARGKVYCHDPSGDGHGGLNGGSWGYLQCGKCHGKTRVSKDWQEERWWG